MRLLFNTDPCHEFLQPQSLMSGPSLPCPKAPQALENVRNHLKLICERKLTSDCTYVTSVGRILQSLTVKFARLWVQAWFFWEVHQKAFWLCGSPFDASDMASDIASAFFGVALRHALRLLMLSPMNFMRIVVTSGKSARLG